MVRDCGNWCDVVFEIEFGLSLIDVLVGVIGNGLTLFELLIVWLNFDG